ncbi:unnamed protein product [Bursaphelenchus xylophilus]|uniref:(pine wood nematode) hypothetical protein n=1 Tax=Bursaphelenchus xylophilus TaxID=6326 RepID=A0A1I7SUU0_BURXY|nr:unnamed protein product [Bursaphelenchus xylophilus]CAG9125877.1 unnamed protein product [Bursaphelenchus xylophilus]
MDNIPPIAHDYRRDFYHELEKKAHEANEVPLEQSRAEAEFMKASSDEQKDPLRRAGDSPQNLFQAKKKERTGENKSIYLPHQPQKITITKPNSILFMYLLIRSFQRVTRENLVVSPHDKISGGEENRRRTSWSNRRTDNAVESLSRLLAWGLRMRKPAKFKKSAHMYDELDAEMGESHEMEPMLGQPDRLSSVHSRIDLEDGPQKPPQGIMELVRRRFTCVYLILGFILLVALAVLVVALMLLFHMRKMGTKFENVTKLTGSENFMRLYEDFSNAKGTHRKPTPYSELINKLTPEQLAQARMYGLLPSEPPENLGEPIKPVVGAKTTKKPDISLNLDENPRQIFEKEKTFYQHAWHDPSCNIQCNKADVTIPPLLIISMDAFAAKYLSRNLVPALDTMAECGARAKFVFPSYPTKTFPNHYTIATGLYPESHGIVDNSVYDKDISPNEEDMKSTKFAEFYKGEPIWSAAVRQRRRMFCLFWPGCSYNMTGYTPTIDLKYNKSMTYSSRIEKINEWLMLPAEERPSLIMAYFDQPDTVGHWFTDDRTVNLELSYMESVLNYMFSLFKKNGILDCTNIVIVSDHGMQKLDKRYYVDEMVDTEGMLVSNGVVGRVYLNDSKHDVNYVLDKLECNDTKFRVYDKQRTPVRYHYTKTSRIGDVLLEGRPGSIFWPNRKSDYKVVGDHGYDYLEENMHAIFFARGPNIRPQTVLEPFQNIEYFNLFTELLRLNKDVPNNGTDGVLEEVVYNVQPLTVTTPYTLRPVQECTNIPLHEHRELTACTNTTECKTFAEKANQQFQSCEVQSTSYVGTFYTASSGLCFINHCTAATVFDPENTFGSTKMVFETLTAQDFDEQKKKTKEICGLNDVRYDQDCGNWTGSMKQKIDDKLQWKSIMANERSAISKYNRLYSLMYKDFAAGPFSYLQNITKFYTQKYGKILSFSGVAYDFNSDGLADSQDEFWAHINSEPKGQDSLQKPTHFFRILMRCESGQWHISGQSCRRSTETQLLAFILPNAEKELNCLNPREYLLANTARVKDIELLSNTQLFHERMWFAERDALRWRTNITLSLW